MPAPCTELGAKHPSARAEQGGIALILPLLVLSILEDPSGNRLGRAFEVQAREAEDEPPPPEQFTLPFTVK